MRVAAQLGGSPTTKVKLLWMPVLLSLHHVPTYSHHLLLLLLTAVVAQGTRT